MLASVPRVLVGDLTIWLRTKLISFNRRWIIEFRGFTIWYDTCWVLYDPEESVATSNQTIREEGLTSSIFHTWV